MATIAQWVAGARPRTLPAALAPVIIGTAAALHLGKADYALAILSAVVSIALQVGVNYANDYSDGIRGTDEDRVGPVRLVGQRLANPANVKAAALLSLGFGAVAGLALVGLSQAWWLLPIGLVAVVAAWGYTGGSKPYGYRGLGEVVVFVFFGLVATLGTLYAQALRLSWFGLIGAIAVGCIASAILVANNLRDRPSDELVGKRTLAVRLGDSATRTLWLGLIGVSIAGVLAMAVWSVGALLGLVAVVVIAPAVRTVRSGATGTALVPVLASTGAYELAYAVLVFFGVALTSALG